MNHMPGAVVWGIMCEQEGAFYMCRNSFEQVGQLLHEVVGCHEGAVIATRDEIVEHLVRELGGDVKRSAIDHFSLSLRAQGLGISPRKGFEDGSIIVLRDLREFPTLEGILGVGNDEVHVAPGAMFALSELGELAFTSA